MKRTAQEIADFVGGTLHGNASEVIEHVGSLDHAKPGDLAYAEPRYLARVKDTRASCVLVPSGEFPDRTVILVKNPRAAFARATQWLIPVERPFTGIHPTAMLASSARLGGDVAVGAWTMIEEGVQVGRSTVIFPGCYIGTRCKIGSDCTIFPNVVLYPGVEVGDRVTIHSGSVIGADGFGFVLEGTRYLKVPQLGGVVIAADVEVGANTSIDRGTLDNTVVDEGAKIDNLCQIGHNVRIGAHAIISAQTGVAGSSVVGSHATIGGQAGIGDYCRIDANAVVGGQCGVLNGKRVPPGEIYWGTPARPLKQIKIQQAYLGRLPQMAEEIERLRAEVDALKGTP